MEDRLKIAFGTAMRKYREAAGLSQEEFARRAGVHRTYVGDVERGERNVSIVNMARIASALEIPLSRLIREMEKYLGR